jgi:ubiquinone/menaquinone biosynthesis C-methylase UbiE
MGASLMGSKSGWQLNGSGPYAYQDYIADPVLRPGVQPLIEAAEIGPGDRVVDLACGTGMVTRALLERVGSSGTVLGIDLNPTMLEAAEELSGDRAADGIDWRRGDAASLPIEDGAADAIVCQQGFQFFADKSAALSEMDRALDNAGRMALSVLREIERNPFQLAIADALQAHIGEQAAAVIHTPFAMHDPESIRGLVAQAGFEDVHLRLETTVVRHSSLDELVPGYLNATPVAEQVASLDPTIQADILAHVRSDLLGYMDDDGLAAPLNFLVVSAHA